MSRLRVLNLSFCDTELSENSSIQGGGGFTSISPYGAVSVSHDEKYSAHWYADSNNVYAQYGSAVASAVAYAAGTGTFKVSSSAAAKSY